MFWKVWDLLVVTGLGPVSTPQSLPAAARRVSRTRVPTFRPFGRSRWEGSWWQFLRVGHSGELVRRPRVRGTPWWAGRRDLP